MPTISITSFGPVEKFTGCVDDFVVLIGPQASGKSTVTKLVYFFKMLPTWAASYAPPDKKSWDHYRGFISFIRHKFINLFGPVSYQQDMRVEYYFSNEETSEYCKVSTSKALVRFDFSRSIEANIKALVSRIATDQIDESKENTGFSGIVSSKKRKLSLPRVDYLEVAKSIFHTEHTPIFIPAGRTLLSLLSTQVGNVPYDERDFIMTDFIETIQKIRPQFQSSLEELCNIARLTRQTRPDDERAALARNMINNVLRGRYVFESGEERIYHSSGYTKLSFASSGQQESIWILLMSYILILERESTFIVFEEPEAHLYPEGQDAIIRVLALLYGANETNSVLVTTHSPYVLTSINNLIFADKVGKRNKAEVSEIIHQKYWLRYKDVHAYSMNGRSKCIMDQELEMIMSEEIDSASRLLNEEFDRINAHA